MWQPPYKIQWRLPYTFIDVWRRPFNLMMLNYMAAAKKSTYVAAIKLLSDKPLHTLSKLLAYDVPFGFVDPSLLRLCIALFAVT